MKTYEMRQFSTGVMPDALAERNRVTHEYATEALQCLADGDLKGATEILRIMQKMTAPREPAGVL